MYKINMRFLISFKSRDINIYKNNNKFRYNLSNYVICKQITLLNWSIFNTSYNITLYINNHLIIIILYILITI